MVDATLPGRSRVLKVTFMECGHLIPLPVRKPIVASNGVAVAHPVDLVAAKMEACCNRGAQRDYEDVAEALAAWPRWCREGAGMALPNRSRTELGRALAAPPSEVAAALPEPALRRLQAFARSLGRPDPRAGAMKEAASATALGYDPHPEAVRWHGTPIPPIHEPLAKTAMRWETASRVWWNGAPWTVLRNASQYLWQVMDYGRDGDIDHTLRDLPPASWMRALDRARPGLLSKGSYVLWSLVFGRRPTGWRCGWPDAAHALDCRMLSRDSRERLRQRQQRVVRELTVHRP